ncbi:uncharacterized protein LOC130973519 [Arachis stenosperma]|uniref:uncharacterized protein LOC130973519 n=1 Tax=Arachis stenosperma TaxID=217475 RepID=UPI0025ABE90D|nr:uncharacterized protein LOC130973519 [Arachis stenosperma]XP_057754067.1 uncharacterized protein LOC130973519 [Arachis stenosperma]XP_057754068.1 uncharacterized protein LOC130973519 [Arachis stenosperma]
MKKKESVNFLFREVQMDCKKRRRTLEKNKDLATANEESSIDSYNTLARHMVEPSSSRSGNRKKGLEPLCEDVYISVKSPFNCPVPEEDDTAYKYWLDYVYVPEEDEEDDGDSLLVNVAEEPLTGDVAEDPQYKLFLDHVKVRGTCYAIEIPEQNIYIEYPDVALTVAYEAQNNVGKDSHAVSAKAQNNVGEYSEKRRGRKPKNLRQIIEDSHVVSPKAQNNVGDYSQKKRRGRKPKYLGQMVKDTHDVSPKAQNHVGECKGRGRGRKPKDSGLVVVKDFHAVSQKAQNYVGKRRGRKPNGLGKHAVKDTNGDGNANVVDVSKAQNNDGKYSGKRRGRKPKELRNDAIKDSNGSCNGGASEAKKNDDNDKGTLKGETPQKNDHIAKGDHIHPPSCIEIKVKEEIEEDDDDSLCKRRRKVPSLNLEHYWHDDKANAMKYTKYREKLMQELEKPYCEEEYKRLFKYMKHKKLVEYHKEHRSGPTTCKRNYLGKSLLNHHVDLNKKLKSVRGDYPKRLTLLRGFVFWLTHCADNEAFKPWIYPEYCKPAPKV